MARQVINYQRIVGGHEIDHRIPCPRRRPEAMQKNQRRPAVAMITLEIGGKLRHLSLTVMSGCIENAVCRRHDGFERGRNDIGIDTSAKKPAVGIFHLHVADRRRIGTVLQ